MKSILKKVAIALFVSIMILAPMFARAENSKVRYEVDTQTLYIGGPTVREQLYLVIPFLTPNQDGVIDVKTVVLEGPGGEMGAGVALGNLITRSGVDVRIDAGTKCVSACAFAALGAKNIDIQGELMFHRFYRLGLFALETPMDFLESTQQGTTSAYDYTMKKGFSWAFIRQVFGYTSYCKFLTFTTTEDLDKFRFDGTFDDFMRPRFVLNNKTTYIANHCSR